MTQGAGTRGDIVLSAIYAGHDGGLPICSKSAGTALTLYGGVIDEPDFLPIDPDLDDPGLPRRPDVHSRPDVLVVIAAGGVLGVAARYGVGRAIPRAHGAFPWATLWINISGSFVLGVFIVIVLERLGPTRYLRPFFGTGFVGSFTTFSAFSVETDLLIKDGHVTTAAAYVASTLVVGLLSAWLGICIGRLIPRRARHVGRESTDR